MRSFTDGEGRLWDVVLGRESWGRIVAIFSPRGTPGPVLEAGMEASGYEDAVRELDGMDVASLERLRDGAVRKDTT